MESINLGMHSRVKLFFEGHLLETLRPEQRRTTGTETLQLKVLSQERR
jgi:hypothetical protein